MNFDDDLIDLKKLDDATWKPGLQRDPTRPDVVDFHGPAADEMRRRGLHTAPLSWPWPVEEG